MALSAPGAGAACYPLPDSAVGPSENGALVRIRPAWVMRLIGHALPALGDCRSSRDQDDT